MLIPNIIFDLYLQLKNLFMAKQKESPKTEGNSTKDNIFKKAMIAFAMVCFVVVIFKENIGYNWVWTSLVQENLKLISKNRKMDYGQKIQAKMGIDGAVLHYIIQKTPQDAIILLPPEKILMNDSASYDFTSKLGGIKSRNWALDLVYPRKLVYFDEIDKNIWKDKITHVMVFDGWGLQYLSYSPSELSNLDVYPINK